jgi:hypothetical protein
MWHAGGTAGEASDSGLPAAASARVPGEARPLRPLASLASARRGARQAGNDLVSELRVIERPAAVRADR